MEWLPDLKVEAYLALFEEVVNHFLGSPTEAVLNSDPDPKVFMPSKKLLKDVGYKTDSTSLLKT